MKNTFIFFTSLILIAGYILAGCDSSAKNVADARENVKDAKDDVADAEYSLYEAKHDSTAEYQTFKRDSEDKITKLNDKIAELKLKISKEQRTEKTKSLELLEDLQKRTDQMVIDLKQYKANKSDDWKVFRDNFKKNMSDIEITVSNFLTDTK